MSQARRVALTTIGHTYGTPPEKIVDQDYAVMQRPDLMGKPFVFVEVVQIPGPHGRFQVVLGKLKASGELFKTSLSPTMASQLVAVAKTGIDVRQMVMSIERAVSKQGRPYWYFAVDQEFRDRETKKILLAESRGNVKTQTLLGLIKVTGHSVDEVAGILTEIGKTRIADLTDIEYDLLLDQLRQNPPLVKAQLTPFVETDEE